MIVYPDPNLEQNEECQRNTVVFLEPQKFIDLLRYEKITELVYKHTDYDTLILVKCQYGNTWVKVQQKMLQYVFRNWTNDRNFITPNVRCPSCGEFSYDTNIIFLSQIKCPNCSHQ